MRVYPGIAQIAQRSGVDLNAQIDAFVKEGITMAEMARRMTALLKIEVSWQVIAYHVHKRYKTGASRRTRYTKRNA